MNNGIFEIDSSESGLNGIYNETGSPERRLLLGILERAILDFVGNELKEKEQSAGWIFSDEDDENDEFTFAWVCSQLDLPISKIRTAISKMPMRGDSRLAPWYMKNAAA